MIRIAIVEDEDEVGRQLETFVQRFSEERKSPLEVRRFSDGDGFIHEYRSDFDIILLDIKMPLMDGFSAAQAVRERDPAVVIIFITNMAHHAIRGYAVDALDFIVKPVGYYSFASSLDRAVLRLERRQRSSILLTANHQAERVELRTIYYVESQDHALIYHTERGPLRAFGKLQDEADRLESRGFARCHASYLVNLAFVEGSRGEEITVRGATIPVSRSRKKAFFGALTHYLSEA